MQFNFREIDHKCFNVITQEKFAILHSTNKKYSSKTSEIKTSNPKLTMSAAMYISAYTYVCTQMYIYVHV